LSHCKIGYTKLVPDFHENFGAPYYVVHRADFHDALYRCAMKLGVTLHVDSRVEAYDADTATVRTANGLSYTGDIVVAADGKIDVLHGDYRDVNNLQGSYLLVDKPS
jgi:salicylate hydroxylase